MSEEPADAEFLQQFLSNRDAPCPGCGYNLRGLTGRLCPECGQPLRLQVGLVEQKIAAVIAGIVALAAGAGLNGLLILYGLVQIMIDSYGGEMRRFFWTTSIGFALEGAALFVWLRHWRSIRRQSSANKRWLVGLAWLLTFADLIIFSLVLK